MHVRDLCQRRNILKYDLQTPILVPSFSSKGFPKIAEIWDSVKDFITDTTLISSYDIYYRTLPARVDSVNLLMIDSGGYEARKDYDQSEVYEYDYSPKQWDRSKYRETLSALDTKSALVLISYDDIRTRYDIGQQSAHALEFFSDVSGDAALDFLIKPYNSGVLAFDESALYHADIYSFDIIGVTEKELGRSFTDRLRNVARLRSIISDSGQDIPIHIFGCLDPLSVWFYFLCGADIFDGLSWLRFVFMNGTSLYRNSWTILSQNTHLADSKVYMTSVLNNIEELKMQRLKMNRFIESRSIDLLPVDSNIVQSVIKSAGVELGGD